MIFQLNLLFLFSPFVVTSGKLSRGFEPLYPDELCIDLKTFCNAFPFHIVFDEQVRHHGYIVIYTCEAFRLSM